MTPILLAFGLALVLATLLTPVVRRVAIRFDLLDHAVTARKIHGHPIPRLGGVAIVASFFGALAIAWWLAGPWAIADPERALAAVTGALLIAALGVVDDLRGANAWQKFTIQLTAAGILYAYGVRIETLAGPFGPPMSLGLLALPVTLLWLVGITNAFNLIDGLDGLAGGLALIALAVTVFIAVGREELVTVIVAAALAGAVAGFLRFNLHPASIFMGDTGSMFLGFVLAALAVGSQQKSTAAIALLVPITVLGLPILDTILAVVRRAGGGRHVFQADREHIHHRLLAIGLTHRRAVHALYAVSAFFGVAAIALSRASPGGVVLIAASLALVVFLLLWRLEYIGGRDELATRLAARADAVRRIADSMTAYDPHAVWEAFLSVSKLIDADCVRLHLVETGADDETVTRLYTAGPWKDGDEFFVARFRLARDGRDSGWVEFAWEQGTPRLDPITDDAVRLFCQDVGGGARAERAGRKAEAQNASPHRARGRGVS